MDRNATEQAPLPGEPADVCAWPRQPGGTWHRPRPPEKARAGLFGRSKGPQRPEGEEA